MRILALGAAGEMGRAAARVLVRHEQVERLVIGDVDQVRAQAAARALGGKATSARVDVTDRASLAAVLADCDIVVNTVGPFFRFGPRILAAAVDAGRDYVDICDDWEPTLDMLAMHERAQAAGVTALIGAGASPGVANLLAARAARELDTVETIVTGWNIDAAQSRTEDGAAPSAAIVHGIRQISGSIRVTRDGELVDRPALEKVTVDYPGIGTGTGRSFGHPEAVTLRRAFPDLRNSVNIAVGRRTTLAAMAALRYGVDHRFVSTTRAVRIAALAERLSPAQPATLLAPGALPPLFAVVTGTHDHTAATVAAALAQVPGPTMAEITGVPLAVAALMLPTLRTPGVHSPETLIDPDAFFAALAPHCLGDPRPTAMTATTRSWATPEANAESLRTSLLTATLVRT